MNLHSVCVRVDSRNTSAGRLASRTTRYGRSPAGTFFHCMSELNRLSWISRVALVEPHVGRGLAPGQEPAEAHPSLDELQSWTFQVIRSCHGEL